MEIIFDHWRMPHNHNLLLNPLKKVQEIVETMAGVHLRLKPPHTTLHSCQVHCDWTHFEVSAHFYHFDREVLKLTFKNKGEDDSEWILQEDLLCMLDVAECRLLTYYKDEIQNPDQLEIDMGYDGEPAAGCSVVLRDPNRYR